MNVNKPASCCNSTFMGVRLNRVDGWVVGRWVVGKWVMGRGWWVMFV